MRRTLFLVSAVGLFSLATGNAHAATNFHCVENGTALALSGRIVASAHEAWRYFATVKGRTGASLTLEVRSFSGFDFTNQRSVNGYGGSAKDSQFYYREEYGAGSSRRTLQFKHRPLAGDDKLHTLNCR